MTSGEAVSLIEKAIEQAGSQNQFAKSLGISQSFVSEVIAGKRTPSPRLLEAVGLKWALVPLDGGGK